MPDAVLKWNGLDHGREGLLHAKPWLATLQVLARHAGESISDMRSPVFDDLERSLPNTAWRGKDGRSFFRDYQQAWTNLGVLTPTAKTRQLIVVTPKGLRLLDDIQNAGNPTDKSFVLQQFFRTFIQYYTEKIKETTIAPFECIAMAILASENDKKISIQELKDKTESFICSLVQDDVVFEQGYTPCRRFRSYLTLLKNAEAIFKQSGFIAVQDRQYLEELVRDENIEIVKENSECRIFPFADLRRREKREIIIREGQQAFAEQVKKAYGGRCCITGCGEDSVLQAAHIVDYCGRQSSVPSNGLLLAADIHLMFDRLRFGIHPETLCVVLSSKMTDERYSDLNGKKIRLPDDERLWPNREALEHKFAKFIEKDALEKDDEVQSLSASDPDEKFESAPCRR